MSARRGLAAWLVSTGCVFAGVAAEAGQYDDACEALIDDATTGSGDSAVFACDAARQAFAGLIAGPGAGPDTLVGADLLAYQEFDAMCRLADGARQRVIASEFPSILQGRVVDGGLSAQDSGLAAAIQGGPDGIESGVDLYPGRLVSGRSWWDTLGARLAVAEDATTAGLLFQVALGEPDTVTLSLAAASEIAESTCTDALRTRDFARNLCTVASGLPATGTTHADPDDNTDLEGQRDEIDRLCRETWSANADDRPSLETLAATVRQYQQTIEQMGGNAPQLDYASERALSAVARHPGPAYVRDEDGVALATAAHEASVLRAALNVGALTHLTSATTWASNDDLLEDSETSNDTSYAFELRAAGSLVRGRHSGTLEVSGTWPTLGNAFGDSVPEQYTRNTFDTQLGYAVTTRIRTAGSDSDEPHWRAEQRFDNRFMLGAAFADDPVSSGDEGSGELAGYEATRADRAFKLRELTLEYSVGVRVSEELSVRFSVPVTLAWRTDAGAGGDAGAVDRDVGWVVTVPVSLATVIEF